ncbi:MAG: type II toxin-antitoxin system VapC family toxin [Thermoplasmatota archaeon]
MEALSVFLDTGVLVAAVWPRDAMHDRALDVLARIASRRLGAASTSDLVLAESFTFLRAKARRRDAVDALASLAFGEDRAPPLVRDVHRVHGARFAATLALFRNEFDRGLSFADASTVVLVRELGIQRVATWDRGFRGLVEVVD